MVKIYEDNGIYKIELSKMELYDLSISLGEKTLKLMPTRKIVINLRNSLEKLINNHQNL